MLYQYQTIHFQNFLQPRGLKFAKKKETTLSAFKEVDATAIPEDLRYEGAVLGVQDDHGNQYRIRIDSIADEVAIIDFNHPLAGKKLTFEVRVVNI